MTDVVSDASPLIVLAKAKLLDVLPALFSRVLLPQAVKREILAGAAEDPLKVKLPHCDWIVAVELAPPISPLSIWQIGSGEAEVIECARLNGPLPVLIDDLAGRRAAEAMGLKVHGTVGLLAAAKRLGHVSSFSQAMAELRTVGLYIRDSLVDEIEKGLSSD